MKKYRNLFHQITLIALSGVEKKNIYIVGLGGFSRGVHFIKQPKKVLRCFINIFKVPHRSPAETSQYPVNLMKSSNIRQTSLLILAEHLSCRFGKG